MVIAEAVAAALAYAHSTVWVPISVQLGRSGGRRAEKGFSAEDARVVRERLIRPGRLSARFQRGNGASRIRSVSE